MAPSSGLESPKISWGSMPTDHPRRLWAQPTPRLCSPCFHFFWIHSCHAHLHSSWVKHNGTKAFELNETHFGWKEIQVRIYSACRVWFMLSCTCTISLEYVCQRSFRIAKGLARMAPKLWETHRRIQHRGTRGTCPPFWCRSQTIQLQEKQIIRLSIVD